MQCLHRGDKVGSAADEHSDACCAGQLESGASSSDLRSSRRGSPNGIHGESWCTLRGSGTGGLHRKISVWCPVFDVEIERWGVGARNEVGAGNCDEALMLESRDGIAQPRGLIARNGGDKFIIQVNLDGAAEKCRRLDNRTRR